MTSQRASRPGSLEGDTSPDSLPHTVKRAIDTDPSGGPRFDTPVEQTTSAVRPNESFDAEGSSDASASSDNEEPLLRGLRRHRAPPKLLPRVQSSSDGEQAVAYYADAKPFAPRFDTLPDEPPVQVLATSPIPPPVTDRNSAPSRDEAAKPALSLSDERLATTFVRTLARRSRVAPYLAAGILVAAAIGVLLIFRTQPTQTTRENLAPVAAASVVESVPASPGAQTGASRPHAPDQLLPGGGTANVVSSGPTMRPSQTLGPSIPAPARPSAHPVSGMSTPRAPTTNSSAPPSPRTVPSAAPRSPVAEPAPAPSHDTARVF
jgi:hypothetical protein